MSTGVGGDAFALVWQDRVVTGLNASGRAPRTADPEAFARLPLHGPMSVTVPGTVSGWVALLERHGRFGLDRCLAAAIDAAESGFVATPVISRAWTELAPLLAGDSELARCFTPAPHAGDTVTNPALGATLRRIAEHGADGLYRGPVAEAICAASWLELDDLATHTAEWVEPLRLNYHGVEVVELPPNGWGATALQALGIASGFDLEALTETDRIHIHAEALKLAFRDRGTSPSAAARSNSVVRGTRDPASSRPAGPSTSAW
jgi:gamma-glutamyltranspeptidase/glutathione hydrolase